MPSADRSTALTRRTADSKIYYVNLNYVIGPRSVAGVYSFFFYFTQFLLRENAFLLLLVDQRIRIIIMVLVW